MTHRSVDRHLSAAQKNEVLLHGDAGRFRDHLQACASCRSEVAAMQGLLDCFGESVFEQGAALQQELQQHRPAAQASAAEAEVSPRAKWGERSRARYAAAFLVPSLAGAALVLLFAVLHFTIWPGRGYLPSAADRGAHPQAQMARSASGDAHMQSGKANAQPLNDDALMEQVNEQLGQDVPTSMQPLTAMVTAESPQSSGAQKEN